MKIPLNKAACMSHLLMLVSTGHRHWISGEMHYSKAHRFAEKMAQLYPIYASADQRSWAKKTSRYSVHLIMFPHDKIAGKIMYWMLATPGAAPKDFVDIHAREKLKDAIANPLVWRDQYECRQLERKKGKPPAWTWCMRGEYFNRLSASSKEAADAGVVALSDLFSRLSHMPLFGGIRDQLIELDAISRQTWIKRRKTVYSAHLPNPLPAMPKLKVWGDLDLKILIEQMNLTDAQTLAAARLQGHALIEQNEMI